MNELDIFSAAVELTTPEDREKFLDEACGDNEALRERIKSLLLSSREAGSFIESLVHDFDLTSTIERSISEGPGTNIGPYKLLQQVGEGGMGVVFMAEQTEPIQRTVAVKIIKPGMDTRQVIARFEAERQALAMMDHPNIAKVLDAGTTDTGRPYFVMELVKGVPIAKYCDDHKLSIRQRLELFKPVCEAVQHAHQKGIIHRDIKPTNVLVAEYDNRAVPKVIDFGVAKATAQKLTERTMFTEFGQVLGTVEYMSPEQAKFNQLDIDTRSDIYSLGVLLYELLTGCTPFDRERLREAAFDEVLRIIREEEPPKPSTRLSTIDTLPSVAANRHTEPTRLSRDIRGELDWIVMRCLEKDRNRRYETANGLTRDVDRYLSEEPIEACPPTIAYRMRKFAMRNKQALAIAVLLGTVILVALAAVAGSVGWAFRDRDARRAAVAREVSLALKEAQSAYEKDELSAATVAVKKAEALLASSPPQLQLQRAVEQWKTDLRLAERLEEVRVFSRDQSSLDTVNDYLIGFQDFGLKQLQNLRAIDVFDLADADQSHLMPRHLQNVDVHAVADAIRRSPIKPHLITALDDWASLASDHDRTVLLAIAREVDGDPWRNRLRDAIQHKDVEMYKSLARDLEAVHQPPASIVILTGQLRPIGHPPDAPLRSPQQYTELIELASDLLRSAQRRHPNDFVINLALAQFLVSMPGPERNDAVGFARVAVARRPESANAREALGVVLESTGRLADAEEEFREALRLKPNNITYERLFSICRRQEKWQEAVAVYEEATQSVPNLDRFWKLDNLLETLRYVPSVQLRNPRRVAELANKLAELEPDSAWRWEGLGCVRFRAGDWRGTVDALERSLALEPEPKDRTRNELRIYAPNQPNQWLYLTIAEWHLGNMDAAREWYAKAVAWIEKNNPPDAELIRFSAKAADLLGLPEPNIEKSPTRIQVRQPQPEPTQVIEEPLQTDQVGPPADKEL